MPTESADIIRYTPPAGWESISNPDGSAYSKVNSNGGSCAIAVLPSIPHIDYSAKDFANDWRTQVVAPLHGEENPKLYIKTTSEGLQIISGATTIQQSGQNAVLSMFALSGNGHVVRVVTIHNDETYLPQLADFINSFTISKSDSSPATPFIEQNNPVVETSGSSEKFGHLYYTPPKGCNIQKYAGAVAIKFPDISDIFLEIRIIAPVAFYGNLEQAREQSWSDLLAGSPVQSVMMDKNPYYDIVSGRKSFRGWDYIREMARVRINYNPYSITLFLLHINDRIERIAVISSIPPQPYNEEKPYPEYDRYRDLVDEFVFSLKFDDWQEPPLPIGTLNGTGIVGVWQGISMFGGKLAASTAVFLSNGQAFFDSKFPMHGLGGLNSWIESERNPRKWGTYSFQDGTGLLRMPYGEIPIKVYGGQLVLITNHEDHEFIRMPSVDGAVFDGTYAFASAEGSNPSSISFTADGMFTDRGALNILNHRTRNSPFMNVTLQQGSGTYMIKDYTVKFNYSDGRVVKLAFPGRNFDRNNPSPQELVLSFNYDEITRQ
jgi:hypothetical protein